MTKGKKEIFLLVSIGISGVLGFASQKLLASMLSIEEYGQYDLYLSFAFIFNGLLSVNFLNFIKYRSSRNNREYLISEPIKHLVFISNLFLTGIGLIVIVLWMKISLFYIPILLGIHLFFFTYEYKKMTLNLNGKYIQWSKINPLPYLLFTGALLVVYVTKVPLNIEIASTLLLSAFVLTYIIDKPKLYKVSLKRLQTLWRSSSRFVLPLILYAVLSWLNEHFGKLFLRGQNVSFMEVGIYSALFGLAMKIIFASTAIFDVMLNRKLFVSNPVKKDLFKIMATFFVIVSLLLIGIYFTQDHLVDLLLDSKYVNAAYLLFPLALTAVLIKYIHIIETLFSRLNKTKFVLFGYIVLTLVYIIGLLLQDNVTLEELCFTQLIAAMTAAFVATLLGVKNLSKLKFTE